MGSPDTNDNCGIQGTKAYVNGTEITPSTYDFPIGTSTVKWEVTDNAGLKASDNQTVTVADNEAPTITPPSDKTANTNDDGTGNCTTTVDLGSPTTSDNCGIQGTKAYVNGTEINPSTYDFPIGTTTVKWEVIDNAGLKATDTQTVTVADNEAPTITAPSDKTANTNDDGTGNCTTTVNLGSPSTNDNCGVQDIKAYVNGNVINPSTYDFPIGTTTVKWEVTDNAGLKASDNQTVTVADNEAPTITAPSDKTANTNDDGTGNCTTTVDLGSPTTSDNCGIQGTKAYVNGNVINPSTYDFPIGTTTVTWEVTDNAGLKASDNQTVTVADNEAPTITAPSDKTANTNDDGTGNCTTTVDLGSPTTSDNCGIRNKGLCQRQRDQSFYLRFSYRNYHRYMGSHR